MLRVLLDTNIFCQDFRLRTSPMGLLLDESKRGRVQILVPVVVLQETTRRFVEEARKQRQNIAQQERALRRFGMDVKLLDGLKKALEDQINAYHSFLRTTLQSHGARFLDTPDVPHQVILDRVLSRRKPISEDGKRGYQDTLIWETILAQRPSGDNMLYFITNNSSDFAERGDANTLSPDLRDDLIASCGESSGVVLFSSLKDFTDKYIKPNREFSVDAAHAGMEVPAQQPIALTTEELSVIVQGFLVDYAESLAGASPDVIAETDLDDSDEVRIERAEFKAVRIGETFRISEEQIGADCEAQFHSLLSIGSLPDLSKVIDFASLVPRSEYQLNYRVALREGILYVGMGLTIDEAEREVVEATPLSSRLEVIKSVPKDPNQGMLWNS
jgi:predicted nucleic acid-binding protein